MKTCIVKISPAHVGPRQIDAIARILGGEGVMAYPTDTFYGLGANCFSEKALHKIYRLKKRPASKPLPILISDVEMVEKLAVDVPDVFQALSLNFWPGPLTLVLRAAPHLPSALVGPDRTVGVRLPGLSWLRALIKRLGFPIVATSANISGQGEIAAPEEIVRVFGGQVDLIVDGGQTPGSLPSTVVDLTTAKPVLLREGPVPKTELQEYLDWAI
jgi:L-threonylcarbamoyladenylate synthase